MANLGKAFAGAAAGIKAGFGLGQEKRRLDLYEQQLKQQEEAGEQNRMLQALRLQVDQKANEISQRRLNLDQGLFLNNILENVYQGRQDITENEFQGAIKMFQEKAQIDPETAKLFFAPIKDEKTGMITGYSYNGQTAAEKIDSEKKKADTQLTKAQTAKTAIETKLYGKPEAASTAEQAFIREFYSDEAVKLLSSEERRNKLIEGLRRLPTPSSQPLTVGTRTEVQKEVKDLYDSLFTLEKISKEQIPEIFTLYGKAKYTALSIKDWATRKDLPPDEREYIGRARIFLQDLEKYFQLYRHATTGAQAGLKEIENLRTATLSPKMTKTKFEYAVNDALDATKKALRIKNYILRTEDISGEKLGKEIDSIYFSGEDPTLTFENRQKRGDEIYESLKNSGLSDKEKKNRVFQTLISEGYMER